MQKSKCHGASVKTLGEGKFSCDVCGHECELMADEENVENTSTESGEKSEVKAEGEASAEGNTEAEAGKGTEAEKTEGESASAEGNTEGSSESEGQSE